MSMSDSMKYPIVVYLDLEKVLVDDDKYNEQLSKDDNKNLLFLRFKKLIAFQIYLEESLL